MIYDKRNACKRRRVTYCTTSSLRNLYKLRSEFVLLREEKVTNSMMPCTLHKMNLGLELVLPSTEIACTSQRPATKITDRICLTQLGVLISNVLNCFTSTSSCSEHYDT